MDKGPAQDQSGKPAEIELELEDEHGHKIKLIPEWVIKSKDGETDPSRKQRWVLIH